MRVVQLHELTPRLFLNPTLNPKNPIRAQKVKKKNSKSIQNQMSELKERKKQARPKVEP